MGAGVALRRLSTRLYGAVKVWRSDGGLVDGTAHYETDSSHTTWLPLSVLAAVDLIAIPGLCVLSAVDWLADDWMTRAVLEQGLRYLGISGQHRPAPLAV